MLLPSLVGCFIPASNAVLQASLSSAFFSLRQMVISSALGMNALQSLKTSGVHAKRCSSVPCEKEGAGQAIADSNASDTRHFSKAPTEAESIYSEFLGSSEHLRSVLKSILIGADTIDSCWSSCL